MKLEEYGIGNNKWDTIVRSFQDYDVFYLSGYARAFMNENPKNGTPILLYYENGEDRAVNVVFCRDVSLDDKFAGKVGKGKYFDLITPYGYGGFRGSVSDWDSLNQIYTAYCVEKNYICEFVRFGLFNEYHRHYYGEAETRTHNVVRNLEISPDELWMDFKQKVRKNVKRAMSYNLDIIIENTDAHLDDFLRIYNDTMERSDAGKDYYFSKQFYETLNEMKEHVMYFYAVHENTVVSAELVIYGTENGYSFLGGTDRDFFDLRPNDFLKYQIIRWAKEKGLKNFVLGGGYGEDDGIFQYKTCLAPHGIVDFYTGRRIFDKGAYDYLVSIRTGEPLNRNYFPLYRS